MLLNNIVKSKPIQVSTPRPRQRIDALGLVLKVITSPLIKTTLMTFELQYSIK